MNRKKLTLVIISIFFVLTTVSAQGDYIVKTVPPKSEAELEDEVLFTTRNFPYYTICNWKAGQKFMLLVEDNYGFVSALKSVEDGRDVSNDELQYKILEFQGTEMVKTEGYIGETISTRFIFEVDGKKYYHEERNKSLNDICGRNPRASIYNLVYLADVDLARERLIGKTLYTKVTTARVDDPNVGAGSREVSIPRNLEVTIKAVGVGTRECPVKLVFEDRKGNSYYRNVMLSKTNSGLDEKDLSGVNREKYFPYVFSFTDREMETNDDLRSKYVGRLAYPKLTINVNREGRGLQSMLRYTPIVIKDITIHSPTTMATLKFSDRSGIDYTVDVDTKYDIFLQNANYIDDMFGFGDLRKQYPGIQEENWLLLGKGEVKKGMTKNECMLALGSPIQMVSNLNSRYETWYYHGRIIEFDNGLITRLK